MSELFEAESGAEPEAALDTSAAAIALALNPPRGRPSAAVERYLARQEELIGKQLHHLDAQFRTLTLDHWQKRLRLLLLALTVLVGLMVLGAVSWMAWEAHAADGLVIKPFSMPPALVQRGITGEAIASKVMDKLSSMAEIARPSERQKSVAADWGEHISIEIPETGVSLSQVDQFLREKLGHQRRVTGEVALAPDGTLAMDARIGAHPLPSQTGPEADLDKMATKVAEAIYAQEQPVSWYQYLGNQGRWPEALEAAKGTFATAPTPPLRAYSMTGIGLAIGNMQGPVAAKPYYQQAMAMTPDYPPVLASNLANIEDMMGHDEQAYRLRLAYLAREPSSTFETPEARQVAIHVQQENVDTQLGDWAGVLAEAAVISQSNLPGFVGPNNMALPIGNARLELHDIGGAVSELNTIPDIPGLIGPKHLNLAHAYWQIDDWARANSEIDIGWGFASKHLSPQDPRAQSMLMAKAMVLAKLGRIDEAKATAAALPGDCVRCLIGRAIVAEADHDVAGANGLYAQAVRLTPSLPIANEAWGRSLLARGDTRGALTRFEASAAKSPRFPDALEGRAEAQLALGDAADAAKGFEAAAKLAPRWGRLHLKWGEALARTGDRDGAHAQLAEAGRLDLTPGERAELAALRL